MGKNTGNANPCKVITGIARVSYAYLDEVSPKSGKYQCQLIFPKRDKKSILALEKAEDAAYELGIKTKWEGKEPNPKKYESPIHDGDEDSDKEECENSVYINVKSSEKPGMVYADADRTTITDRGEIYSGCYVIAQVVFAPYNFEGKKGVGVFLQHLMKVKDGDRLGGGRESVESAFSDVDTSEFNYSKSRSRRSRDDDDDEEEERPRRRSNHRDEDDDERPKKRSSRYDDEEEERPRKRTSRRDEDDEDERPRKGINIKKRREDDYEDFDDDERPRPKKRSSRYDDED
jgi:hypothetical protein